MLQTTLCWNGDCVPDNLQLFQQSDYKSLKRSVNKSDLADFEMAPLGATKPTKAMISCFSLLVSYSIFLNVKLLICGNLRNLF